MAEYITLGKVSTAAIRNFLMEKRVEKGDTLVISLMDYDHLIEDIKASDEPIDIPLKLFGVRIIKDTSGDIPVGKIQIVKNESTIN
jgi:hypothetical protein